MKNEILQEGVWSLLGSLWDKRKARQAADEASDIYLYLRTHIPHSEYKRIRDTVGKMESELAKKLGAEEKDGRYSLSGALYKPEMRAKVGEVRAFAEKTLGFLRTEQETWKRRRKEESVIPVSGKPMSEILETSTKYPAVSRRIAEHEAERGKRWVPPKTPKEFIAVVEKFKKERKL